MRETTRVMQVGGQDYRERLTLTFVPSLDRRYKEIYCLNCSKKILETPDDLAYVSDTSDLSVLQPGVPGSFGMPCKGMYCKIWYEVRTIPGVFTVETTRIFFVDTRKKYRQVHCPGCKQLFASVEAGAVYSIGDIPVALKTDNGFVPTYCPACLSEYDIATNVGN